MLFAGALAPPLLRLPRVPLPGGRSVVLATKLPTADGPSENPSAARSNRVSASRNPPPRPPDPASGSPTGGALRGSDVLLALQRAVAEKEARRLSEKRRRRGKRRTPTTHGGGGDGGEKGFDSFEQVRPIEIRSDWETRIEELEKRIQELRSQYQ
ncbi:uncharacterized protein LOC122031193 [Zingiber officinale]|uniref:Uncharacterized protein n=1 Tax=Zingiber officinale TaxID=94328 RepID=A0A8J5C7C6_ZINOF|nr:uncharacterized protein LOC122031193 [Zingiber officinale]KAG6469689.1 hypothetical protein ZIOFF_070619 [Zingiber officinale]